MVGGYVPVMLLHFFFPTQTQTQTLFTSSSNDLNGSLSLLLVSPTGGKASAGSSPLCLPVIKQRENFRPLDDDNGDDVRDLHVGGSKGVKKVCCRVITSNGPGRPKRYVRRLGVSVSHISFSYLSLPPPPSSKTKKKPFSHM